eukprot:SAG31_NODE_2339_length_5920_cov_15.209414_5_plen_65_part_00
MVVPVAVSKFQRPALSDRIGAAAADTIGDGSNASVLRPTTLSAVICADLSGGEKTSFRIIGFYI